jgi:hypothetical protein
MQSGPFLFWAPRLLGARFRVACSCDAAAFRANVKYGDFLRSYDRRVVSVPAAAVIDGLRRSRGAFFFQQEIREVIR